MDTSYSKFFNTKKSPSVGFSNLTGAYNFPKHFKKAGHVVWDSNNKGTYVRSVHGELK